MRFFAPLRMTACGIIMTVFMNASHFLCHAELVEASPHPTLLTRFFAPLRMTWLWMNSHSVILRGEPMVRSRNTSSLVTLGGTSA